MSVGAEHLREACVHVDALQAQPVDPSAARDERDRRRVADEPIVFEWSSHMQSCKQRVFGSKVQR